MIVNSANILDKFDKASSIYSDRPILHMGGELVGLNDALVLLPYSPRLRSCRRHFYRYMGPNKPVQFHHPLIEQATQRFLKAVIKNNENINGNI